MNPQNYKCTTRAGVLKRIAGLERLVAVYRDTEKRANADLSAAINRIKNDIRRYKRQLESLPLKRKKITL